MSRIAVVVVLILLVVLFKTCSVSELPPGRPALEFTAVDVLGNKISLFDFFYEIINDGF